MPFSSILHNIRTCIDYVQQSFIICHIPQLSIIEFKIVNQYLIFN